MAPTWAGRSLFAFSLAFLYFFSHSKCIPGQRIGKVFEVLVGLVGDLIADPADGEGGVADEVDVVYLALNFSGDLGHVVVPAGQHRLRQVREERQRLGVTQLEHLLTSCIGAKRKSCLKKWAE